MGLNLLWLILLTVRRLAVNVNILANEQTKCLNAQTQTAM